MKQEVIPVDFPVKKQIHISFKIIVHKTDLTTTQ